MSTIKLYELSRDGDGHVKRNGPGGLAYFFDVIRRRGVFRFVLVLGLLSGGLAVFPSSTIAQTKTEDQKIKQGIATGLIEVKIQDHTRDACDRGNNVTVTSATDRNVVLKPREEEYFKINKDKDDYTRSGGWYWKCGNTSERARISGSTHIKAIRKENGVVDWYWVLIELK